MTVSFVCPDPALGYSATLILGFIECDQIRKSSNSVDSMRQMSWSSSSMGVPCKFRRDSESSTFFLFVSSIRLDV